MYTEDDAKREEADLNFGLAAIIWNELADQSAAVDDNAGVHVRRLRHANALANAGQYDAAVTAYETAGFTDFVQPTRQSQRKFDASYAAGVAALHAGDLDTAVAQLGSDVPGAVWRARGHGLARLYLGMAKHGLGDTDGAKEEFERAELFIENVTNREVAAFGAVLQKAHDRGQYDVVRTIGLATRSKVDNGVATLIYQGLIQKSYKELVHIMTKGGDLSRARRRGRRTIALEAGSVSGITKEGSGLARKALFRIAQTYEMEGRLGDARANYRALLGTPELNDKRYGHAEAHYKIGRTYEAEGRHEDALQAFNLAVRNDPKHRVVTTEYHAIAERTGAKDHDAARQHARRVIAIQSGSIDAITKDHTFSLKALFKIGETYDAGNRPRDARVAYRQSLNAPELNDKRYGYAELHYRVGMTHIAEGRTREANKAFQTALALDPAHTKSKGML